MFYSILGALCLCIGFYFGFFVAKNKDLPHIHLHFKNKQEKKAEQEMSKFRKSINNLDSYDGSKESQEDIV